MKKRTNNETNYTIISRMFAVFHSSLDTTTGIGIGFSKCQVYWTKSMPMKWSTTILAMLHLDVLQKRK